MINDKINIEQHNVKWIFDHKNSNRLSVDNSFQRNYVWTKKHQIKLIETILMGFPMPEIYIWNEKTNPNTGDMFYSIIDGQQRIGAIFDFIQGAFALESKYIDDENKTKDYVGKKFEDLNPDDKNKIWKYKLSIRFVVEEIGIDIIKKMFLRLNSNNMTLNPQELRNAEFDGEFIGLCSELCELSFFDEYRIFSKSDIRRMQDIQFISTIIVFFRNGISEGIGQENINKIYTLYNSEYPQKEEDRKLFTILTGEIKKIVFNEKDSERFLRKKVHLYVLYLLAYTFYRKNGGFSTNQISWYQKFTKIYEDDTLIESEYDVNTQTKIKEYKKLSSAGTQNTMNRISRFEILKNILDNQ